jgi:hypothetical protein
VLSSHRIPSKSSFHNPKINPLTTEIPIYLTKSISNLIKFSHPYHQLYQDVQLRHLPTVVLALLTSCQLACATPINPARRQDPSAGRVTATLSGAAGAQYTVAIAMDKSVHPTNNALSISHIDTAGGPCDFFAVDGAVVSIPAAGAQDVGPPQAIVAAACGPRTAG